jgi:hypothetical protein
MHYIRPQQQGIPCLLPAVILPSHGPLNASMTLQGLGCQSAHVQSAQFQQAMQCRPGKPLGVSKRVLELRLRSAHLPKMARSYCGPAVQALAKGSRPLAAVLSMHQLASVAYCARTEQTASQATACFIAELRASALSKHCSPILDTLHCRAHAGIMSLYTCSSR